MDEAKSVRARMHSVDCCKRRRRASVDTMSPVKLEPSSRHHDDADPASLQAELERKTAELAQTQAERDAALARLLDHDAKTELQAELWRTTEKIKLAAQERDAAVALQSAHRELQALQRDRDSALADLAAQKLHQKEQEREVRADLQCALARTRGETDALRQQRDELRVQKELQLSEQCDAVFEVEMALKMELRRAQEELERARREQEKVVLDMHLQQEHMGEQVRAIEAELQGLIQVKAEELKAAQRDRDRDRAVGETCRHLEMQCDQVTEVEVRLQRNLKCLLGEIRDVRAGEIREALVAPRQKLHDLKKQRLDRKPKP